jgi:predicted short-subunit dehydrogenase-like oxidoreductase (DUF2520 family)
MKVVIIGSGNVATVLGGKTKAAGHEILQIVARNPKTASAMATEWACCYTSQWSKTDQTADIYVVALSDMALENLGSVLALPGKLVVHTAGAASVNVLESVSANCGVLYPLQSLKAAIRPFPETPLLIDALRQEDLPIIEAFAQTLSGQVQQADDSTRLKLHVAGTLVNNFTNYLYTQAARFCREETIDFSLLLPLIRETAERISRFPPEQMQTGPAVRGDRTTIEKHLNILSNYIDIKELYDLLTIKIEDFYRVNENPAP